MKNIGLFVGHHDICEGWDCMAGFSKLDAGYQMSHLGADVV